MKRTFTKRCPACNKLLDLSSFEERKTLGNSMAKCPFCGYNYIDTYVYEWVNLTNEEKKSVLVFGWNMTIVKESEVRSLYNALKFTQILLLTIPLVSRLKNQLIALEMFQFNPRMLQDYHIQESIERTNNADYLRNLLNAGRNFYGTGYEEC